MAFVPKFELYDSTNTTKLYTFIAVQETNIPQSTIKNTVVEGRRGIGAIVVTGSESSWEMTINGSLFADDYENITPLIDALEAAVPLGDKFYLRLDKTASTHYEYRVMRLKPIQYPQSLRNNIQEYRLTFLVNSW